MRLRCALVLVGGVALGAAAAPPEPLVPGEANRWIRNPLELCPPGAIRHRDFGFDDRARMWVSCTTTAAGGKRLLDGPYVTWDEERTPQGPRYVLREIMGYATDTRHGEHLVFAGPFGNEALVERETYRHGLLEGESTAYFLDGSVRERRQYVGGQLDGPRIGYSPGGDERWRVTYAQGEAKATAGDLTVAGQRCPADTVPTFAPDGRSLACARRYQHFLERQGPFVVWDADGRVVESGVYDRDEKKELWTAPPGVVLPPRVSDETLVAEIELLVGDEPFAAERFARREANGASDAKGVDIWFRDNGSKKYPSPRTEVHGNVVQVYGLPPGSYYIEVDIDANAGNDVKWPGDLVATLDFPVVEHEIVRRQARLLYTLHMLAPWDNGKDIPGWSYPCEDAQTLLTDPVRFTWERPPVDPRAPVEYTYRLAKRQCNGEEFAYREATTDETDMLLDLPPSKPGEVYEWTVTARVKEQAIGQLMTFGGGGYGWGGRFRVRKPGPDEATPNLPVRPPS